MKIEKKLFDTIYNYFPDANIDSNKWKEVFTTSSSNSSIFHLLNTVEYYVSSFSYNHSINLSMVLYFDNKAVGIMPLMAHQNKNKEWILSSNGHDIIEPIFKNTLTNKIRKKIEIKILDLIFDLSKQLKIKKCQFINIDFFKLSKWYINLLDLAEKTFASHYLLVDLSLSLEKIKSNIRKSFKPLINKGLREWNIEVHEHTTKEQFEKFRKLHRLVSGKSTRPIQSWNIQRDSVNSNESFAITVSDKNNLLVGFGLFVYTKYSGSYTVGVYRRDLFNKPLGHAVQMKVIETFKDKGLKWYEIGMKYLNIDKITPTEKELSISFFKEGFATDVLSRQHLIVNMSS